MTIEIRTRWNTPLDGEEADYNKHAAFAGYAIEVIESLRPSLLYFLEATDARVIVGKDLFSFCLPCVGAKWYEDEEIAASLKLLPWEEPTETMH